MINIYTTSKFECSWCVKAKDLLEEHDMDYFEKDIHTNELYKLEFIAAGHKTVPQIYYEEDLIGGYEKLRVYLSERTG